MLHGLDFFVTAYGRPDGTFANLAAPTGEAIDPSFDLYNQAFALLAFASIAKAYPAKADEMLTRANLLRMRLNKDYKHPQRGFEEGNPPQYPLRANPHMHMLESALAMERIDVADQWRNMADEIVSLCVDKFIHSKRGTLHEFFDPMWRPLADEKGRWLEPGHHYEWASLLIEWGRRRARPEVYPVARRLFEIAEQHGVDRSRNVAVAVILDDWTIKDQTARLWPQTERLKAALALMRMTQDKAERSRCENVAAESARVLQGFLDVPVEGLWRDKLLVNGQFVEEPAPASSFYHIVCAISELTLAIS
jgi:mannose/cellobiose epimerase-like protein (N-acyl-D-glucosamine 2-epimerase family)